MEDIVQRLRADAEIKQVNAGQQVAALEREAAAEIERLRRVVTEMTCPHVTDGSGNVCWMYQPTQE